MIEALQRGLDRPEISAITNCLKFNKSKCQILHLGQGSAGYPCKLGERLESSPAERDQSLSWWQLQYKSAARPGSQKGQQLTWRASGTASPANWRRQLPCCGLTSGTVWGTLTEGHQTISVSWGHWPEQWKVSRARFTRSLRLFSLKKGNIRVKQIMTFQA